MRCTRAPQGPRVNKRVIKRSKSGTRGRNRSRSGGRVAKKRAHSSDGEFETGGRRTRTRDRLQIQVKYLEERIDRLEYHDQEVRKWIDSTDMGPVVPEVEVKRGKKRKVESEDEEDPIVVERRRIIRRPRYEDRELYAEAHNAELEYEDEPRLDSGQGQGAEGGSGEGAEEAGDRGRVSPPWPDNFLKVVGDEEDAQGEREEPTGEGSGAGAGPNPEGDEVAGPGADEKEKEDEEERGPSVPPIVTEPEPEEE